MTDGNGNGNGNGNGTQVPLFKLTHLVPNEDVVVLELRRDFLGPVSDALLRVQGVGKEKTRHAMGLQLSTAQDVLTGRRALEDCTALSDVEMVDEEEESDESS
jgi:hypothetical protein